jgi:predicted nucleotidyltransferase
MVKKQKDSEEKQETKEIKKELEPKDSKKVSALKESKKEQKNEKKQEVKEKKFPTLELKSEREIAMDFAEKAYKKFDKLIKSIVLFGSAIKHTEVAGSDIDLIIILDDASVGFDDKLILWYREELAKIIQESTYKYELHITTAKLTTWWEDLVKGDPTVINMIRYGEAIVDFGGFFNPLKILLQEGKIKTTPESIYTCLQRVPLHITQSKQAELSSIEGIYWAFVDASQALLMSIKVMPPSPEHIPILLKENFADKKLMKMDYVIWYRDLYDLHRKIVHGEINNLDGSIIDKWQERAETFFKAIVSLIDEIIPQ